MFAKACGAIFIAPAASRTFVAAAMRSTTLKFLLYYRACDTKANA
jgi:hypothetical protein